jgi:phospholipase C
MLRLVDRSIAAWHLRQRDHSKDRRSLPDPSKKPGTDLLPRIRHIVLLMMENHSYDNYLGTLGRGDGMPLGNDGLPSVTNRHGDGRPERAHHLGVTTQAHNVPTQSWYASHLQFANGENSGFVASVEETVPGGDATVPLGYWTASDLPFYSGLAETFPLADRWFCSCLGPTFPNRRFLLAATANGLIDDVALGMIDYPAAGTIFDLLDRRGVTWVNYHHSSPLGTVFKHIGLRGVRSIGLALGTIWPSLIKATQGNIQFTADLYPLGVWRCLRHLRPIDRFFADAAAGTLPDVCVVDPDFQSCSEENPQDIQIGEGFAAAVIDAVMHGKAWENTLLIWFYDEHGGYYDHVPPPAAPEPDDVRPHSLLQSGGPIRWLLRKLGYLVQLQRIDTTTAGGRYDRLGFRVPAVVVAPFAKPDFVSSTVYDHTSALKLIEEKWNLPPLTRRDAAAVSPLDMVDLIGPAKFIEPPPLPAPARPWLSTANIMPPRIRVAQNLGLVGRTVSYSASEATTREEA